MAQFAFKRTGDADYPRYLKILLQGPPKSGKTTFLATAPNVVVAAVEAGLMSIAHRDLAYVEIDGTDKLQTLQMVLSDDALRAQAARQLGIPKVETVAIDTLDAWQEMLKKEIMKENRRTQMQQADWGTLKERMATILKAFVALPVNVIFTVHTTTTQDDEGRLIYAPNLQGSIKDDIAGFVDFSLLAFRQREVDEAGVASIQYYLKNEGDLKNPTLGNRAAGRVPEVCKPEFGILHTAVFKGIKRKDAPELPTEIVADAPSPIADPEPRVPVPAPRARQASPAPAAASATPAPAPTGRPAPDEEGLINAAGITMLTKEYLAQGLVLPQDIKTWKLGKARLVARWFVAWKADKAAGQDATREDLIEYLGAQDAFAGELSGVQTGVDSVAVPPKPSVEAATPAVTEPATPTTPTEEVTAPEPAAAATPVTPATPEQTDDGAQALIEDALGGVQIGYQVADDAKCEVCGNPIDDKDVANLGMTRFKKMLCFKDYKEQARASV